MTVEQEQGNLLIIESPFASAEQSKWLKNAEKWHELPRLIERLKYHSEWNWIMPVCFQIKCWTVPEQNDEELQYDLENACRRLWNEIAHCVACINIEMAWKAVVAFITWYNTIIKK